MIIGVMIEGARHVRKKFGQQAIEAFERTDGKHSIVTESIIIMYKKNYLFNIIVFGNRINSLIFCNKFEYFQKNFHLLLAIHFSFCIFA